MDWKRLYKLHSDIIVHPFYGTPIYHLVPAALSGSCMLCVNYTCLEAAMVFEGWFGGKLLHACLT